MFRYLDESLSVTIQLKTLEKCFCFVLIFFSVSYKMKRKVWYCRNVSILYSDHMR